MKLSLSWIFDHIDVDIKKINTNELIDIFSKTTAEVEYLRKIEIDVDALTIIRVAHVYATYIAAYSPEFQRDIELPLRDDVQVGQWYMIIREGSAYTWATSLDLGGEKEYLMPALAFHETMNNDSWKKHIEKDDYIIEVGNISLTNRPDMWSHRGFAREFAVLLDAHLKKLDLFLEPLTVLETTKDFLKDDVLEIQIKDNTKCKHLSALKIDGITNKPSSLFMAVRLARIDSRAINTIVDATNYTMFDIGQPMHAFDASAFQTKMVARAAQEGEKVLLLDGQEIELTPDDCVIATDNSVLSLAGIMGGKMSSVSAATSALVIESACFDAGTIRKTSSRLKLRSESSARYEKSLDPNQNVDAIRRFVKLCKGHGLAMIIHEPILSVGSKEAGKIVIIEHDFIVQRLGVSIEADQVVATLKALGFDVLQDESTYKITVPTQRATKDIALPEDILEEIIRFYGYDKIPFVLPVKETLPHNIAPVLTQRTIKNFMAYAAGMMELNSYPFYDEDFLKKLGLESHGLIEALSPVSQNWKKLIDSLVPHLFKGIQPNLHKVDSMRFFELNRIWQMQGTHEVFEKKSLAALVFNYKNDVDFYVEKQHIQNLYAMLGFHVSWVKATDIHQPWFDRYATADIMIGDAVVGRAGLVDKKFLEQIVDVGQAFVVELDADFLLMNNAAPVRYKALSRFPSVILDISLLVPLSMTFDAIKDCIVGASSMIKKVELVDTFTKDEWRDKKSMTLRYHIVDETKTLTKEEIDMLMQRVHDEVLAKGMQIR